MRTQLLLAALILTGAEALAAAPSDAPLREQPVAQSPAGGAAKDDEDEEDPAPGAATPAPAPAGTKTDGTAATPSPAAQPQGAVAPAAAAGQNSQQLVSGAPLYNPNVAVHIVEQKQFSDSGKREVILFPAAIQINGKFTQHYGTALGFVWHINENFGFQVMGQYNWVNIESAFNTELVDKIGAQAEAASALLWTWGVVGGVEVAPVYGKFALFDETLAHFSIVLNAGAGVTGTRAQLKPQNQRTPMSLCEQFPETCAPTYGDTGIRFMGQLGGGFRVQLGKRFSFRMEVRDLVYTARVDSVNGCNSADMTAIQTKDRGGQPAGSAAVSSGCRTETFEGTTSGGYPRSRDITPAVNLVKNPTSDVLNNIGFYMGAGFIF